MIGQNKPNSSPASFPALYSVKQVLYIGQRYTDTDQIQYNFHRPISNRYISLAPVDSSTSVTKCCKLNAFLCLLFVRWEVVPGEGAVHYVSETLQQRREVCQQLGHVSLPDRLHRRFP